MNRRLLLLVNSPALVLGLIPNHVLVDANNDHPVAPARNDWSRLRG
jgi:hypothetical protein